MNLLTLRSVAKACLSKIVEFLAHPYPRVCIFPDRQGRAVNIIQVRSSTAEHLYIVLQSKDLGWEADERAEEILLETEWYA